MATNILHFKQLKLKVSEFGIMSKIKREAIHSIIVIHITVSRPIEQYVLAEMSHVWELPVSA